MLSDIYDRIPRLDSKHLTPFWNETIKKIEGRFIPNIPTTFLQDDIIVNTMVCGTIPVEWETVKKWIGDNGEYGERLRQLLIEPSFGGISTTEVDEIKTSGNIIHQAYHMVMWMSKGRTAVLPKRVVEFGGGFGAFARLYYLMGVSPTYVIVDVPIMSCIQYEYLSCVLGLDRVVLNSNGDKIEEGKINIVPLSIVIEGRIRDLFCDMFVSNWALSECPKICQEMVSSRGFFGAKNFLMAGQSSSKEFPEAGHIFDLVKGSYRKEIKHLRGNYYLIKKEKPISILVFSKDRPLFLDTHLETLALTIPKDDADVTVYFMATSNDLEKAYDKLRLKYPWACFVKQTRREELMPFLQSWAGKACRYVLITVDDNVYGGKINTKAIEDTLADEEVFGFNLRLHPGIRHTQVDGEANDPGPSPGGKVVVYEPSRYGLPWNYIWEMSSTVFRRESLLAVLNAGKPIPTVNDLETVGLGVFPTSGVKKMACFSWAPVTNIFVDSWLSPSIVSCKVSNETAFRMYNDGERIDVEETFRHRDQQSTTHVKELLLKKRLNNSAIVVVPSRNCEPWTEKCLRSILEQTYSDIGIVFIDDVSTDKTAEIAEKVLGDRKDVVLLKNRQRQFAMKNHVTAIKEHCSNPESVIFTVDGDDWLDSTTAIERMMEKHKTNDVVWSKYRRTDGSNEMRSEPLVHNNIRKHPWVSSHLRSFKKFLFDAIKDEDFRDDDGDYFCFTCDHAMMFPVLEMTPPERRLFYDSCLYVYNRENAENDDKVNEQKQIEVANKIRSRPPYYLHPRYLAQNLEAKTIRKKVCFLVTATGRYISFVKPLVDSMRKWCKDFDFKVVVFTDSDDTGFFEKVFIPHSHWPFSSLGRFRCYLDNSHEMEGFDYVFAIDADTIFMGKVGLEIFGNTVATESPAFYNLPVSCFQYERRESSSAFIPTGAGHKYYAGAFYGGEKKSFTEMLMRLVKITEVDLKNGVMAIHHDESYLNRYLLDNPPEKILSPSYCYAPWIDMPLEKKIVLVEKDDDKMRRLENKNSPSRVGVVVPCFNRGKNLQDAIQSVLNQTHKNFEIILVDYGSSDNTTDIMEEYRDKAVVLSIPNRGYANARNKGIAVASSDYILCLDADDKLLPEFLEEAIKASSPKNIVATYGRFFKEGVADDGEFKPTDVDFNSFISHNKILSCSLFSKKMWQDVGGYDEAMPNLEDWDFWLRAMKQGYEVSVVKKVMVEIRRHGESVTKTESESKWTSYIMRKMYGNLEFSEEEYFESNPDVRDEVIRRKISSGWEHYVKYGNAECRKGVHPFVDRMVRRVLNPACCKMGAI